MTAKFSKNRRGRRAETESGSERRLGECWEQTGLCFWCFEPIEAHQPGGRNPRHVRDNVPYGKCAKATFARKSSRVVSFDFGLEDTNRVIEPRLDVVAALPQAVDPCWHCNGAGRCVCISCIFSVVDAIPFAQRGEPHKCVSCMGTGLHVAHKASEEGGAVEAL